LYRKGCNASATPTAQRTSAWRTHLHAARDSPQHHCAAAAARCFLRAWPSQLYRSARTRLAHHADGRPRWNLPSRELRMARRA